ISQKAFAELGDEFSRNPVGFGPFQLDSIEPGVAVTFSPHEDYFRGEPKLTKVTYRFLSASSARDLAFLSGELDAATGTSDQNWLKRVQSTPGAIVDIFDPSE